MTIKLSDYDYSLPTDYIAQYPQQNRSDSRLLILDRRNQSIEHKYFKDIVAYFHENDCLVLNNTRVVPARLYGQRRTGGKVELLLLGLNQNKKSFECLIRPGRVKIGERIEFPGRDLEAVLVSKNEVEFNTDDLGRIYSFGNIPLPPYIKRQLQESDKIRYQTVYARHNGSVASPTAGLHFTEDLLNKIKAVGAGIVYLTLHIGYSTFKPIKTMNVEDHKMGQEHYSVSRESLGTLKKARLKGGRIFSVGTSSTRALETIFLRNDSELNGSTGLFIYPGFSFKAADCLITNFHHPRTSPFMLVAAFAGRELMQKAYREALAEKYRFLSFGDSMLIQ